MEENQEFSLKLVHIPCSNEDPNQNDSSKGVVFIGIIDASGSMSLVWETLARCWNQYVPKDEVYIITFDGSARICPTAYLSTNINVHGGGSTNISAALNEYNQILMSLPQNSKITTIFVSDGQHNYGQDVKSVIEKSQGYASHMINFLCLGVGHEFPTFLSMQLREKYHNGHIDIPKLFLVEVHDKQKLTQKFLLMVKYFLHREKISVKPPVYLNFWEEPMDHVFEDCWVMTPHKELNLAGKPFTVPEDDNLEFEGIYIKFSTWRDDLLIRNQKGENIKEILNTTLLSMRSILKKYQKKHQIDFDCIKDIPITETMTFHERAKRNYFLNKIDKVQNCIEELEKLKNGENLQNVSEYDFAKRLSFKPFILENQDPLSNFPPEMFRMMIREFKDSFECADIMESNDSIKTQRDLFLEEDFSLGFKYCITPSDLINSFPIFGYKMEIVREASIKHNPWEFKIIKIHETKELINSLSKDYVDKSSTIILPLFNSNYDQDIKEIISSKLFKFIIGSNLMQEYSQNYQEAYFSLLAKGLCFFIKEPESHWKLQMIEKLYSTLILIYSDDINFLKYRDELLKDTLNKINNNIEGFTLNNNDYGNIIDFSYIVNIEKSLTHLLILAAEKKIAIKKLKEIHEIITMKYIFDIIHEQTFNIENFLKISWKTNACGYLQRLELLQYEFMHYKTFKELEDKIHVIILEESQNIKNYDFKWDFKNDDMLMALNASHNYIFGYEQSKQTFINYFSRAYEADTLEEAVKKIGKNVDSSFELADSLLYEKIQLKELKIPEIRDRPEIKILKEYFINFKSCMELSLIKDYQKT